MSYIKREPLLQIAKELQGGTFGSPLLVRAIEDAPAEDVVEVRHGENISKNHPVDEFICSECRLIVRDCCRYEIDEDADGDESCYEFAFRFCPRCGVKID